MDKQKYIKYIVLVLVSTWVLVLSAQTIPETGSSGADKTLDELLQNKQSEQLQLPKDANALFSDSYVDPKTYYLGPYDILFLSIWQPINLNSYLTVSPEGMIVVPRIGEFDARGKTLDSVRREVLSALAVHINKNVQASLTLYKPKSILVYVNGYVKQAGMFMVNGNARVSYAVQIANQTPKEEAQQPFEVEKKVTERDKTKNQRALFGSQSSIEYSLRGIVVQHIDGSTERVDLLKYDATHEDSANPMLREGDQIFVPKRDPQTISIYGAVNQPGSYEYVKGDKLTTLLGIAHGPSPNADLSFARLEHYDQNGKCTLSESVNIQNILSNTSADIELQTGDGIILEQQFVENFFGAVAVSGEAVHPGIYSLAPGKTRLSEVIQHAGGFTVMADTANGFVLRRLLGLDGRPVDLYAETQTMYMHSPLILEDTLNFDLQSRFRNGAVAVDFEKLFVAGDQSADIILQDGDEIDIPKNLHQVYVYGDVVNPGFVAYSSGKPAEYYIKQAGGEGENSSGNIQIIRGKTYSWSEPKEEVIRSGDYIYVPKSPDFPVTARQQETTNILTGLLVAATFASIIVNYILFHK